MRFLVVLLLICFAIINYENLYIHWAEVFSIQIFQGLNWEYFQRGFAIDPIVSSTCDHLPYLYEYLYLSLSLSIYHLIS